MFKRERSFIYAIVFCTGCSVAPKFIPPAPLSNEEGTVEMCKSFVAHHKPPPQSRNLIEATFRRKDDSYSFRYVIVTKEPDKIRIDLLPNEGAFTLGMLVASSNGATMIDTQNRSYLQSNDVDALISRFLSIEGLGREAVVALVTRSLPEIDCHNARIYEGPTSTAIAQPAQRAVWFVSTGTGSLQKLQVLDERGERVELEGSVAGRQGSEAPSLTLELYEPYRISGSLSVQQVGSGKAIPDALFEVAVPAGYSPVE